MTLSVSSRLLQASGEWITVSWSNVENPAATDWIGVYSPPSNDVYRIDPVNHAPIKYQVWNCCMGTSLQYNNCQYVHCSLGKWLYLLLLLLTLISWWRNLSQFTAITVTFHGIHCMGTGYSYIIYTPVICCFYFYLIPTVCQLFRYPPELWKGQTEA